MLIDKLKERFYAHKERHPLIEWEEVEKRINREDIIKALSWMEETGGEPDVIGYDENDYTYIICDCSKETPDRRSVCYDEKARLKRKKNPPQTSAQELADAYGVKILDEREYLYLQTLGGFDLKTSSWILTPDDIRSKGGALFGEKRYDHVFIYHNCVKSYYSERGFRVLIKI